MTAKKVKLTKREASVVRKALAFAGVHKLSVWVSNDKDGYAKTRARLRAMLPEAAR